MRFADGLLLGFMPLVLPPAASGGQGLENMIRKTTHTYKTLDSGQELKADVYRPEDNRVRPVVLFLHGGALIMGDRSLSTQPGTLLAELVKAGYAVVSIDYRLAPAVKLPAILEDVQDAYRWVREQGPKLYSIDPQRLAVMGQSAGGYLTLTTGYRVTPRPRALVSFWGYGDIAGSWYSRPSAHYRQAPLVTKRDAEQGGGSRYYLYLRQQGLWPKALTGHDPDSEPRAFDPFCPLRNVSREYPPTLLIHGTKDTDVPYEQSELMDKELTAKGIDHEFLTIPGGGHGIRSRDTEVAARVHGQVIAFLKRHLK